MFIACLKRYRRIAQEPFHPFLPPLSLSVAKSASIHADRSRAADRVIVPSRGRKPHRLF